MKKILLLSLLGLGINAYSQVDVSASAGTATATYTTLKGAFDAINAGTHQGDISLSITANTTETATAALNATGGTASYTSVSIKPATGITPTISGSINGTIVRLLGSNITIDGSNTVGGTTRDLTIKNNQASGTPYVLQFGGAASTSSASNVIVKNSVFVNGLKTAGYALALANGSGITAGYFTNITIQNNDIQNAYYGINVVGNTASGNGEGLLINGNNLTTGIANFGINLQGTSGASTISNNTIKATNAVVGTSTVVNYLVGIQLNTSAFNVDVFGNTVTGISNTSTSIYTIPIGIYAVANNTTTLTTKIHNNTISDFSAISGYLNYSGIAVAGATVNVNIYANKISGIRDSGSGNLASGIYLASTSTTANILVSNNFISDITGKGSSTISGILHATTGKGYKVYNNTISLSTTPNTETGNSAPFYSYSTATATGAVDLRNNILANSKSSGLRYAIYSANATNVFTNIDYNDYYSTGDNLGYIGANKATLTDIQSGFGGNTNSLNVTPTFVGTNDLHLKTDTNQGLDNKGITLAEVTTDIDNNTRGTNPDMGAAEFTYVAPIIVPNCTTISVPVNNATNVKPNSFYLTWAVADRASSYKVYLGTTSGGTDIANGVVVTGTTYFNSLLNQNTTYFAKVVPSNNIGDAIGCSEISFTTGSLVYCGPIGTSAPTQVAPILSVNFSGTTQSSDPGVTNIGTFASYQDFTSNVFEVKNDVTTLPLTVNGVATGTTNGWGMSAFIDWNNDGDFDDTGEQYFNTSATMLRVVGGTPVVVSGNIAIPSGVSIGNKRMRVKYNFTATTLNPPMANACSDMSNGQVEDYTINYKDATLGVSDVNKAIISVFPNPFTDVLKISDVKGVKSISVNDMAGRQVKSLAPSAEINLSNLNGGLYIVNLQMEDGSVKSFKAIKK